MILKAVLSLLEFCLKYVPFYNSTYRGSIYLFKVNNGNIGTMRELCSKLTIKTLDIFHNLLYCFSIWLWRCKYQLRIKSQSYKKKLTLFSFIKVRCEFWTYYTSKMGDFVKILNNLFICFIYFLFISQRQ